MSTMIQHLVCVLVLAAGLTTTVGADTINVPGDYPTIQAGIDAAQPGDTVLVADGVYAGGGNKNLDFYGKAITVRSANGPESCIIDCEGQGRAFYFHSGESHMSVVDGFTITNGSMDNGGGIACADHSDPAITRCVLIGNAAAGKGGGVYCEHSDPTITFCDIEANVAFDGGGVYCEISDPHVVSCTLSGNMATNNGGAIYCDPSDPTIMNCLLVQNMAERGAGIYCEVADPPITNCTFAHNVATSSGGAALTEMSDPHLVNCVLWGNVPEEIFVSGGTPLVVYSVVQGGWMGVGNVDMDPLFVDPGNGDYRLSEGSPAIDAGCNWSVPPDIGDLDGDGDTDEYTPLDLDGEGRFFDDPATPDTGCGSSAIVDMGAYEFGDMGPQPCFGDFDDDRDVDLADLAMLLAHYGETEVCQGDLNCDGDVELDDLAALLAVYGTTCP